jgi:potassium voltage-gated channel Shal-related subfamily D protein
MAKNASGNAFISSKKKAEELMLAREMGIESSERNNEDVFALQHHHMLMCLENATVRTRHGQYRCQT